MGEIILAAKCTHVPTMLMSEQDGPVKGRRQSAIDGYAEIARRAKALGADTVVICETHWVINAGFRIYANDRFKGLFTSNEFPQFIQDIPSDYEGNPALDDAIDKAATDLGTYTLAHHLGILEMESGALVRTRFMSHEHQMKGVSIAVWCTIPDTAMLYGALGRDDYTASCEVVTPYCISSGTGQTNAIFPVQ